MTKTPEKNNPSQDLHDKGAEKPILKPSVIKGEVGGPQGPEPTRYGDWEKAGRCSDF